MYFLESICSRPALDPVWNVIGFIVKAIWIGIPILLIIFGMLDLGKAVMAQKEDEIKKGQKVLISRCIAAAIVFFVVAIVQLVVGIIAPEGKDNIINCIDTIVNGVEGNEVQNENTGG